MFKRAVAVALLFVIAGTAAAQIPPGGGGRGGRRQQDQQQGPKSSAVPSGPVVVPQLWPRLDEGAILCKSREDLVRYQSQLSGGAASGSPAACRTIQKPTGIQILDRDGPSRTQVVTSDDAKETGWTNTYLPSTPPPSVLKSTDSGK